MRSVVLIHGLLTGMGHEETCEMLAMKESVSGTPQVVFSHCSVIDAPLDLPDGAYTVSFNGYTVPAKKEGGLWIPEEKAVEMHPGQELVEDHRSSFQVGETGEILSVLKLPRGRVA